jgi:formamidopyrimidine-DNA glycosylase
MGAALLLGVFVFAGPGEPQAPARDAEVFTPSHRTVGDSVRDFLQWRRGPVQPIAFAHKVHLANGLECDNCHTGVAVGPQAVTPGVKFCMSCHMVIAADRPEIKKIAAFQARGEEIPWERVYDYSPSAHVRFNHAPHIRAEVPCGTCHGDMTKQTVAQRAVDLNMGYCINCHVQRKASIECSTCHF